MNVWKSCQKILCVRLDNIGDLLMTMPALKALKEACPDQGMGLLVSSCAAEAAEAFRVSDEIIVYDAPWIKASGPASGPSSRLDIIEILRQRNYGGVVIFTVFSQSPLPAAAFCFMAGIPQCLAYCHENPYQLISHWIKDPDPKEGIRHEVQRQLDLVSAIGAHTGSKNISLNVPVRTAERVRGRLRAKGIQLGKPLVVIHPGATAPSRRYPPNKFINAAAELLRRGYQLAFTGKQEERALIEGICSWLKGPYADFTGELNFLELAALIETADVLLTNNTAPAHMAAAVQTPTVVLYALTNPQHTPWMVPSRVLYQDVPCKYCYKSECPQGHHHCLEMVSWQEVVASVDDIYQQTLTRRTLCTP